MNLKDQLFVLPSEDFALTIQIHNTCHHYEFENINECLNSKYFNEIKNNKVISLTPVTFEGDEGMIDLNIILKPRKW